MQKPILRISVPILALLITAYLLVSWYFSSLIITPRREMPKAGFEQAFRLNNDEYYSEAIGFEIQSEDDITIKGTHLKSEKPAQCAIILSHGWNNNQSDMFKFIQLFKECGCDILTYDHRGHGRSGGKFGTGGILEKIDLLLVTKWAASELGLDPRQIGWLGLS